MEENIKERIKRLCREHGITAAQLERELGFGNGYVSKLDKSVPSTRNVKAIADYFQVSPKYILTGEDAPNTKAQNTGYYYNEETAQIAQAIYDDRTLSLLFDEARDASPEDLMQTYTLLKYLKEKERKRGD